MTAYVFKRVKDYYKYEYQDWTQPVLTANGTLGGNSFAVSSNLSDFYKAFDNNNDSYINGFNENCWFTFYNPNPLKVSAIEMLSTGAAYMPRAGTLEYSDDNVIWVKVFDWNSNSANPYTMTVDAGYHKYWKVTVVTKGSSIGNADIASVKITAQEQITVKGSVDDYDFRTSKAYVLKRKQYWKWEGSESTELAYACYLLGGSGISVYYYAKLPLGSDLTAYYSTKGIANSSSELAPTDAVFSSISESSVVLNSQQTLKRYTAGDIYETVNTKVAVPATKDDYDFTTDKAYVLRRK